MKGGWVGGWGAGLVGGCLCVPRGPTSNDGSLFYPALYSGRDARQGGDEGGGFNKLLHLCVNRCLTYAAGPAAAPAAAAVVVVRCDAAAKGAPSIVLPHQEASYVRHIALDIGGSLIKLVGGLFVWGGGGG